MNVLTGFVIYAILFVGVSDMPILKVESLTPNTPAYNVLKPQDKIVAINGSRVWYYKDFKFILNTVNGEETVNITVKREGKTQNFEITPYLNEQTQTYNIGIILQTEKMNFFNILKYLFYELFFIIKAVVYSLIMLVTGRVSFDSVSGPVGTVSVMSSQIKNGFNSFLSVFGLITVNIGIFNLLPIPALDGGRVFFLLVELICRKPVPKKMEGFVHFVGLMLLMLLMLAVTVKDVSMLIGNR